MYKSIVTPSIIASLILSIALLAAPMLVIAEEAETEVEKTESSQEYEAEKEALAEQYREAYKQKVEAAREAAKQKLEEQKDAAEAKKLEVRQKSCEARSEALANKITATVAAAKRHQAKIDSFNVKINDFKTSRQLVVENYDALYVEVQTKAAASQAAVDELASFSAEVDCTDVNAATAKVVAYKEALKNTRDALKEYKTATKNLLVAVRTAAETEETDSSSSETESQTDDSSSNNTSEGAN